MNVRYIFVLLLFFASSFSAHRPFAPFDYRLTGYIKGEMYTDSRQTVADEDDEISYFPKPQIIDPEGHDSNARGSTRIDAFETRVSADFSGIVTHDAQLTGKIEADFEFFSFPISNILHMRHAYGKLSWYNFSFLFGQTWHPMVFIESKTINYNGSSPFDFYARSPQFTCVYHSERNINLIFTASSETEDFDTDGPDGFSTRYIRRAVIPNLHAQCKHTFGNHTMGAGIDYKRITPRIESDIGFKVHERLNSLAALWYLGLHYPSIEINTKINWGQNATDYSGIGGYAVVKGSTNPISYERTYTNLNTIGCWADIEIIKNKKLKPGMFIGFTHNLGSNKPIEHDTLVPAERNVFGFATDVDYVFRLSTRLTSTIDNILIAGEVEYTNAHYGCLTDYGRVINTTPAELIRCTFALYYNF